LSALPTEQWLNFLTKLAVYQRYLNVSFRLAKLDGVLNYMEENLAIDSPVRAHLVGQLVHCFEGDINSLFGSLGLVWQQKVG